MFSISIKAGYDELIVNLYLCAKHADRACIPDPLVTGSLCIELHLLLNGNDRGHQK